MRYSQILLEYNREKTIANWSLKLRERIATDTTISRDDVIWSVAGNTYYVQKVAGKMDHLLDQADREVMAWFEYFDPTANKQYVQWMIRRYVDGGIQRWEDLDKAGDWLGVLERLKASGYFRRHPEAIQSADIGRYKTLSELGDFITSLKSDDMVSANEQQSAIERQMIEDGEVDIKLNTATCKVLIPKTYEASKWFGKNTQWCTAMQKTSQYFDQYSSQGPLYIVLEKATNRRWQLHFESGQFMDERDSPIDDWSVFPREAWNAIDVSKVSDEGIFLCLNTSSDDFAEELPYEIISKILAGASNTCLAAIVLNNSMRANEGVAAEAVDVAWSQMTSRDGRSVTVTSMGARDKFGKEIDLIDYGSDLIGLLIHLDRARIRKAASALCKIVFGFASEDYQDGYDAFKRAISKIHHIVSYGDKNSFVITFAASFDMRMYTIHPEYTGLESFEMVSMQDYADSLVKWGIRTPNEAAIYRVLKKAEMMPVDD